MSEETFRGRKDLCRKTGKIAHGAYYEAVLHMKRLNRRRGEALCNLSVYRCQHCGHFHVGRCAHDAVES